MLYSIGKLLGDLPGGLPGSFLS